MSQPIKDKIILFLYNNAIWIAVAVVVLILFTLIFFYFYNRKNLKKYMSNKSVSIDTQKSLTSSPSNKKEND